MKQSMLKERVELLAIGEWLGYPRLGYGRSANGDRRRSIPAGQTGWEKFVRNAHVTIVPTTLRIARMLKVNGVRPYNPSIRQQAAGGEVEIDSRDNPTMPVIRLDDPIDEILANPEQFIPKPEMVKPKKSAAAIRQARFRERQKASKASG